MLDLMIIIKTKLKGELETIYNELSKETKKRTGMKNFKILNHLVEDQIKNWLLDSYT